MKKKVFISYRIVHSLLFARQIAKKLKNNSQGDIDVFLDKEHLSPGSNLSDITEFIKSSDLLILIINSDWFKMEPNQYLTKFHDSRDWIRIEVEAAIEHGIKIFPVLISDIRMPDRREARSLYPKKLQFLNIEDTVFSKVNGPNSDILYDDFIRSVFAELDITDKISNKDDSDDLTALSNFPLPEYLYKEKPRLCPYPGLSTFSQSDAPIFFGRNEDIIKFWDIISQGSFPLILVVGYSGVGKSSFVKAGLIPRLRNKSIDSIYIKYNKIQSFLSRVKERVGAIQKQSSEVVLFIDQVEESLINSNDDKHLYSLFNYIHAIKKDYGNMKIVLSFRKEFLLDIKTILYRTNNIEYAELPLLPLNRKDLIEAINGFKLDERVSKFYSTVEIEEGLPEYISHHISESKVSNYDNIYSRTPLLQLHLSELWKKSKINNDDLSRINYSLKVKTYDNVKTDSLNSYFDKIMEEVSKYGDFEADSVKNGLILNMLNELVTTEFTSYMCAKNEFVEMFIANNSVENIRGIIQYLEDSYLIRQFSIESISYIALSHDAWGPIISQKYSESILLGQVAWKLINTKYNINISSDVPSSLFTEDEISIVARSQKYMKVIPSYIQSLIGKSIEQNNLKRQKLENALSANLEYGLKNVDRLISKFNIEEASSLVFNLAALNSNIINIRYRSLEIIVIYLLSGKVNKALGIIDIHKILFKNIVLPDDCNINNLFRVLHVNYEDELNDILAKYFAGCASNFVLLEGGDFQMGNSENDAFFEETPSHPVTVSSFYIQKTPFTFYQMFPYCIASSIEIALFSPNWGINGDNPVVNINWFDAEKICKWINSVSANIPYLKEIDSLHYNTRLPTEAEWEYSSRGGPLNSDFIYSGGNNIDELGYFRDNSKRTSSVASKVPNEIGIFDMSGGVREWCNDIFSKSYYDTSPSVDPMGPNKGFPKVLRGGSWLNNERACRVYARFGSDPKDKNSTFGFRLAESPE